MKKSRWLALLLSVVMVIGLVPAQAFALVGQPETDADKGAIGVEITAEEGVLPEDAIAFTQQVGGEALTKTQDGIKAILKEGQSVEGLEAVYPRLVREVEVKSEQPAEGEEAQEPAQKTYEIIAPNGKVSVTLTSKSVSEFAQPKVYRIDAVTYAAAEIEAKLDAEKGTATFDDESFGGIYAIADIQEKAEEPAPEGFSKPDEEEKVASIAKGGVINGSQLRAVENHTVTFMDGDEVYRTLSIPHGSAIGNNLPAGPSKTFELSLFP